MISASETAIGTPQELRRVPEPRQVPREEERDVSIRPQVLVDGLPVEESPGPPDSPAPRRRDRCSHPRWPMRPSCRRHCNGNAHPPGQHAGHGTPASCCENAARRGPRPSGWRATGAPVFTPAIARERETRGDDATPIRGEGRVSFLAGGMCRRTRTCGFLPLGPGAVRRRRTKPCCRSAGRPSRRNFRANRGFATIPAAHLQRFQRLIRNCHGVAVPRLRALHTGRLGAVLAQLPGATPL